MAPALEWAGADYDYFRPFWETGTYPPGTRQTWNLLMQLLRDPSPAASALRDAFRAAGYYDALSVNNEIDLWKFGALKIGHVPGGPLVAKFPIYATTRILVANSNNVTGVNISTSGQSYDPCNYQPNKSSISAGPILAIVLLFILLIFIIIFIGKKWGPWAMTTIA